MNAVIFPVMDDLIQAICNKAKDNAHISMLSRTHGQVICYILHGLYLCITMLLVTEGLQYWPMSLCLKPEVFGKCMS